MNNEADPGNPEGLVTFDVFWPEPKSSLIINGNYAIHFSRPKPNWWIRFWQRVLLGWVWTEYQKPDWKD